MLRELLALNIFGFFFIFARIGTAIMPILPVVPQSTGGLVMLIVAEALIGVFMGIMGRVGLAALQTAGAVIALVSSMANALIQDPIAEQQSAVVSTFMTAVGLLLLFVTDMHHLMIEALIQSYTIFVPGKVLSPGDFAMVIARHTADSFALGLQMASPFVVVGLGYYVGLGVLGRLMPALPLFFFAMPIQIALQITIVMMTLPLIMMLFLKNFQDIFVAFMAS